MSAVDARTVRAYAGSRWMKKTRKKVLSMLRCLPATAASCARVATVCGRRAPRSAAVVEVGAGRMLLFA